MLIGIAELYEVLESFGMLDKAKKETFKQKLIHLLGGEILEK